jgi:hypothetical protein
VEIQNSGEHPIAFESGSRVSAYLPPDALRVISDHENARATDHAARNHIEENGATAGKRAVDSARHDNGTPATNRARA